MLLRSWAAARVGGQGPTRVRGVGEPDATIPTNLPDGRAGSRIEGRQPGVASALHDATKIGLPVTGSWDDQGEGDASVSASLRR